MGNGCTNTDGGTGTLTTPEGAAQTCQTAFGPGDFGPHTRQQASKQEREREAGRTEREERERGESERESERKEERARERERE